MQISVLVLAVWMVILMTGSPASAKSIDCRLTYDLEGWSFFYKTSKGSGRITCSNGRSADVAIVTHGGGLTFGTVKVIGGKGVFSAVSRIDELYGNYAEADVHAGAGRAADARFLLKDNVNLSLVGLGHGISVGFAFGGFSVHPK